MTFGNLHCHNRKVFALLLAQILTFTEPSNVKESRKQGEMLESISMISQRDNVIHVCP